MIRRHLGRDEPFDAATADVLGRAFDEAWAQLQASHADIIPSAKAEQLREMLARHIIDAARAGERSVDRLRDDALAHVRGALRPN